MDTPQVTERTGGAATQNESMDKAGRAKRDARAAVPEARALAPQPVAASPLDLPAAQFRSGLARRKENRAALMEWVRGALVEGGDYGRIHVVGKSKCRLGNRCQDPAHFSKPSLFKPGAEKICGMLGVTVHYPTLPDYEQSALCGVRLHQVILRCEIQDASGRVVADGVGARALEQDYGDINKALKMAEKSAHIDATLRMAGLSEVFTQDLEDMAPKGGYPQAGAPVASSPSPEAGASRGSGPVPSGENGTYISETQRERLEARIAELGLDRERVKAWVRKASRGRVHNFDQLTPAMYRGLDDRLAEWGKTKPRQEQSR